MTVFYSKNSHFITVFRRQQPKKLKNRFYGILPTSIARKLLLRYQQKETVRITDNKKPPFRRVLACNFCGGYPPIIFLSPPIRRGGGLLAKRPSRLRRTPKAYRRANRDGRHRTPYSVISYAILQGGVPPCPPSDIFRLFS